MTKNSKIKIVALSFSLIAIFFLNGLNFIGLQPFLTDSSNNDSESESDEIIDKIDQRKFDNIDGLKTANGVESNISFSFNASITEEWNQTFVFNNVNSTKNNILETEWMNLTDTKGAELDFGFLFIDIINLTDRHEILPENLTIMYLSYLNESLQRERIGVVTYPGTNQYHINGSIYANNIKTNESSDAKFIVWNDWLENTNISFHAYVIVSRANRTYTQETKFIPTPENTDSNMIDWELKIKGHHNGYTTNQAYDASIEISELEKFTLNEVQGYNGTYWSPLNYTRDATHIFINKSCFEYKIKLQTPNYISIVYNDNLTNSNKELQLYVTCKMGGNLTIRFIDQYGNLTVKNQTVIRNQIVFFNHLIELNDSGGIGSLNVILGNGSNVYFGIKFAELTFHKAAYMGGFTENTTAFSEFMVAVAYIDWEYLSWASWDNSTHHLGLNQEQILNSSMIVDATVTYEFADIAGELELAPIGVNIKVYLTIVDLREYLIKPGEYNITFQASKPGYTPLVYIVPIVIEKKTVLYTITSVFEQLTIEERFAVGLNLHTSIPYPPYYENFLRAPVNLSTVVYNNDTGLIDDSFTILSIVQSVTLAGTIDNESIPGVYRLEFSVISDYYEGNHTIYFTIVKKTLNLGLDYDSKVKEDESFDIGWDLQNNNFTGNRENMTIEVYVDGELYQTINMSSPAQSSGSTDFKFKEGTYTVKYKLVSPFYSAEVTIDIESEAESKAKETEKSWLEQNILWIILAGIGVIAVITIIAISSLVSRRKIKAKRNLESELIALKTKTLAIQSEIDLLKTQLLEIAGLYWIIVVHSDAGVTMTEISDFKFEELYGADYKKLVGEGPMRDSALISGFLTAIRNFSGETTGATGTHQAVFNSETDYSTFIQDKEVHRRILEGETYFIGFMSLKPTKEITDVLTTINKKFRDKYNALVREFKGGIDVFRPFQKEVVDYLHEKVRELEQLLNEKITEAEKFDKKLSLVQDKIGIKKKKEAPSSYK